MSKLCILHLTDLHWAPSNSQDIEIVTKALADDIRRAPEELGVKVDLIVFSGDLVQGGDKLEDFLSAKHKFLEPVLDAANINEDRLFIVAGNHDIMRETVRSADYIDVGLASKLNNVDSLNRFIDRCSNKTDLKSPALERMENYENFRAKIKQSQPISNSRFLQTYKIIINNLQIGIACFNTSWRATGEADNFDRRRLLIGERNIDIAINDLDNCAIKIAVFHHPLDWLAEFDDVAVSARLYSQFDIACCGHIHRSEPSFRLNTVGNSIFSQSGCIYQNRDYFNGYQYIILDTEAKKVDFLIRSFQNIPRRSFDKALNVAKNGSFQLEYNFRNDDTRGSYVEKHLQELRGIIRQSATEFINIREAAGEMRLDAKKAFVPPPLTSARNSLSESTTIEKDEDFVSLESLLIEDKNYVFIGSRESGKSSLCHFLAVTIAEGKIDRPRIPVIVDSRRLKRNFYGLRVAVSSYLGITKAGFDLEKSLLQGDFVFLIDNYDGNQKKERLELANIVKKYNKNRWFLFCDSRDKSDLAETKSADKDLYFKKISIGQLPRKSIRELSSRWCELTGNDSEKTFNVVMDQLKRGNLPRTGYIVTLLLWALYQEKRMERINEAVLLTNIVDYLLGKADFTQSLSKDFDPTSKEITLQSVAAYLYDNDGYVNVNDITEYLINFFRKKDLLQDASGVLQKLIECGILARSGASVGFKYRCFQDYFYAKYLQNNQEDLRAYMQEARYVNVVRELDLLSGLSRQNKDLIDCIVEDLRTRAPEDVKNLGFADLEAIAKQESSHGMTRKKLSDIRKKKITSEQIDDLLDQTEARLAASKGPSEDDAQQNSKPENVTNPEIINKSVSNTEEKEYVLSNGRVINIKMSAEPIQDGRFVPGAYMTAIDLLGRIIRNSEFTDGDVKMEATRTFLLGSSRVIIIYNKVLSDVVKVFEEKLEKGEIKLEKTDITTVRYALHSIVVNGGASMIAEQLGTEKLFGVYERILESNESSYAEKMFVTLLLLDLKSPHWHKTWIKLIDASKDYRLILDVMVDRIWTFIHTHPLDDSARKDLVLIADRLEKELGTQNLRKNDVLNAIKKQEIEIKMKER